MKTLNVIAAGLGYGLLERNNLLEMAGVRFRPAASVFPAVTCVAQASLRTGLSPAEHGMISNGRWFADLRRPLFWEQSARLVRGPRVWDARRAAGGTVGLFFLQQSLGESADVIISPAPIHKHGGGMVMSCYTKPTGMAQLIERLHGRFPLWRYWGPLASPKVGRTCISWFEEMTDAHDVDEAYLYLPTLDYAAQAKGPDSPAAKAALREFRRQLERLADVCMRRGCALKVVGDYEIKGVTAPSVRPNVTLRRHDLFRTRAVAGRAYPDFYQSAAFAMCDHEVCAVYGERREEAARLLVESGDCVAPPEGCLAATDDAVVLLARQGSWCEYVWWTDAREAPDFANHVDIHNKPGFDPKELFFFNRGDVKGTHGRPSTVAQSEE
ncbi:MAG: alkaline phosphatase family protein [Kiritimatiellae bacterium]|nr:alkaline phosphatase family protein [Kiritimatiellia bacterium]